MQMEQIIGDLLIRHNCVIIPEFGGFVTQRTAAKIDTNLGVITPPSKSLLFNRQLINNDGLLIAELAQQTHVSYDEARLMVQQLVKSWNETLSSGQRITIDKVGFLFFDQERNICFEQDRYFNLLLSSYGLGNVHFLTETDVAIAQHKAIQQEKLEVAAPIEAVATSIVQPVVVQLQPVVEQQPIVEPAPPTIQVVRKKSNVWKYAAAACLIPVLFYSFWIPMKTNVLESKIISLQDFNPFHQHKAGEYQPQKTKIQVNQNDEPTLKEQVNEVESNETTYSLKFSDDTYVLVDTNKPAQEENAVITENNTAVSNNLNTKTAVSSASMHVIVGCFSDVTNAQTLVKELQHKGFQASIKDVVNGLSRVSIGGASTQDELNQLMAKAKSTGFNGWVLK